MERNLNSLMTGLKFRIYPNGDGMRWHASITIPYEWGQPTPLWREGGPNESPLRWTDEYGTSEAEVREKVYRLIGGLYGWRLASALAPITVPAQVIESPREVEL